MPKTSFRSISFLLCLAVIVSLLSFSTSPARHAQAQTPEPTATVKPLGSQEGTITIWADRVRTPVLEKIGKDFTAKYNVPLRVQELDFGSIRDQLKIAGPAGEGPDIVIGAHDWLGELVSNGLLSEMDLGDKAKTFDPV